MTLCVGRLLEGGWREFEVKDYIFFRWEAGRLGGSGGGEWFGGVITKGREEKVNVGFVFGFGPGPESGLAQPFGSGGGFVPGCRIAISFMQRR
jgi:hypothetical protein